MSFLAAGLVLAGAIATSRRLPPPGTIVPLAVSGFLALLIYGLFFKSHFMSIIRRRI